MFEYLIRNVSVYCEDKRVLPHQTVAVQDGRIAGVGRDLSGEARCVIDGQGRLLSPSFVDTHMHIDEAFTMDDDGTLSIISACNDQDKCNLKYFDYTREQLVAMIVRNAGRVVDMCARNGTMLLKTNALLLPAWGTAALEAMKILKREKAHLCEIRVNSTFPPALEREIRAYVRDGTVDGVAGYPYMDETYWKTMDRLFAISKELALPIDLHIGESDVPDIDCFLYFMKKVKEYHYEGKACCGHLTALTAHGMDKEKAEEAIQMAGECRLHVASMTSCNLYLMSMNRRGPTCIRELAEAGCNVSLGSDNIRDTFRPWGNCNLLEEALLTAKVQHYCSNDELRQIYHMITFNAAKNAAIRNYGILPGNRANMVLLDAQTPEEAIIETAAKTYVWKDGRLIAQNGTLLPEETRSYTNG